MRDGVTSNEWTEYAALWRRRLEAEGKPESTITAYLKSLTRLTKWTTAAAVTGDADSPESITDDDMDAFFAYRRGQSVKVGSQQRPASATTIAMDFRHLRVFFNYLVSKGIREISPLTGMCQPKVADQPPDVFDIDDLRAMLHACGGRDFAARRDTAILRVFFDCGIRHEELARLCVSDVNRRDQLLTVAGKGGSRRDVPYGATTAEALQVYVIARNKHPHAQLDALWLAVPAHGHSGALGYDGIRLLIKRRAAQAGLEGRVFPHMFRHTAAHRQKIAGMNDDELMVLFGWRSRAMPGRYGRSAAASRAIERSRRLSHADEI